MKRHKPRQLAVLILDKIENENSYANLELSASKKQFQLNQKDHGFLTELVYGTLQHKRTLDYYLSPFVKSPQKLDSWVLNVLRVAVYQLVYLNGIPAYAIINEAVNYAKTRGHKGISSMVNGVLRNLERQSLNDLGKLKNEVKKIAIPYSLPDWLVERFINQLGFEETEKLAQSFNKRAKTSVRVHTDRISVSDASAALNESGYPNHSSELAFEGLIIEEGLPITHPLYHEGSISIQDESAMLVAPSLQVEPSHIVADLCAAPGGKTSHIASFLDDNQGGIVYATDIHNHKVKLLHDMVERTQANYKIKVGHLDATQAHNYYQAEFFDRILIDAPCSGIGLLRRKPDIRYRKSAEEVSKLSSIQLEILDSAAQTLKVGGKMVYSTCTILDEENTAVVHDFLAKHPEFELSKIQTDVPIYQGNHGEITVLPQHFDSDGFYIALLVKKAPTAKLIKKRGDGS